MSAITIAERGSRAGAALAPGRLSRQRQLGRPRRPSRRRVTGGLSTASRLASAAVRGRVASTYFVFAYLALTISVIGVGRTRND
jgi:hypothetical protein